jgi:heme exporter protein A
VSQSSSIVDLEAVSVRVGATHILRDVTLAINGGDAVGIFGGNGAGKTTLLRLIATLILPAAGTARVFGIDIATDDRYDIRTRIGYVGHTPGLYPEMTLAQNLGFVAQAMGIDPAEADRSLAAVGLAGAANRRAEVCSHGMQRRAEFARVLMTEPELLLLDEPHSALDADAVELVDALVGRTLDAGGAAVLVSHDKERVLKVATEFHEITGGNLL